jgi:hypothetical protein
MKYNEKSVDAAMLGKIIKSKKQISSVVHNKGVLDISRDQSLARGLGINLVSKGFYEDE